MFAGLQGRLGLAPRDRAAEVYAHLLMLARAQYAVELGLARVRSGSEAYEEDDRGSSEGLGIVLTRYADLHGFLVSAALYWKTLKALTRIGNVPELDEELAAQAGGTIEATLRARHHAEHVHERILSGRAPAYGPEMTAETFRSALGRFEGKSTIRYGDERFDLEELATAIRESGERLAPRLRELLELKVTVKQTPPPEPPAPAAED